MLSIQELAKVSKIIPVVKIKDIRQAVPLARALYEGGIGCMEITFRTEYAIEAVKEIRKALPEMLVGAGTVITGEQAQQAVRAGAVFLVSPGFSENIAAYCQENGVWYLPGCITPTEIMKAMEYKIKTVKFFPAEANGGIQAIQALSGPFGNLTFVPTGGVHPGNLKEYLEYPKVLACGGSWMVKESLLEAGDFEGIRQEAKKAVELAKSIKK